MRLKLIVIAAPFLAMVLTMVPSLVMAWPWTTDMMNQPSIKPQEGAMHLFPQRSIPVQGIPTKVANRQESKALRNPISASKASLTEGKTLFKIYCAACHGLTGKADSPVSSKIGAISLLDSYVQEDLTEGWLWGTITFGSYVMPAYGVVTGKRGSNDLSVEERWHVVNYVRNGLVKDSMKSTVAGM